MPPTFDDAWLFTNVTDMRGDADRWAYSPEYEALFLRYKEERDRNADRCLLYRHLVKLRKRRHEHVRKGARTLPEAREAAPTPDLSEAQKERLCALYAICQRSGFKLAYTDEFQTLAYCFREQWPIFSNHQIWIALDTLRKNGRLPKKGSGIGNAGRRGFGAK